MLRYYLPEHMASDQRKCLTTPVFNRSLYENFNVHKRHSYRRASERKRILVVEPVIFLQIGHKGTLQYEESRLRGCRGRIDKIYARAQHGGLQPRRVQITTTTGECLQVGGVHKETVPRTSSAFRFVSKFGEGLIEKLYGICDSCSYEMNADTHYLIFWIINL